MTGVIAVYGGQPAAVVDMVNKALAEVGAPQTARLSRSNGIVMLDSTPESYRAGVLAALRLGQAKDAACLPCWLEQDEGCGRVDMADAVRLVPCANRGRL